MHVACDSISSPPTLLSLSNALGLWCLECASYQCSHSPKFDRLKNCFQFDAASLDSDARDLASEFPTSHVAAIRVASKNCVSMKQSKADGELAFGSRVSFFKRQLVLNEVSVAGFQETRTEHRCKVTDGFVAYTSDFNHGSLGVQLWFNRKSCFQLERVGN